MAQTGASIMIDDTAGEVGIEQDRLGLFSRLAEICSYRVDRSAAVEWSSNLDLITYDDEDDVGHADATFPEKHKLPCRGEATCEMCFHLPRFPGGRVRKFKMSKQIRGKFKLCVHYLAISYCWPKDSEGNPMALPKSYRVRFTDQDGVERERQSRAPDCVIDRAVEIAHAYDIRQIWIDQECLPQDDSYIQELGVQGMDRVYQRAALVAGLLESEVHTQSQLQALSAMLTAQMVMQRTDELGFRFVPEHLKLEVDWTALAVLLETLADDRWHTRGWILQESLAADQRIVLTMKHQSPIDMARVTNIGILVPQAVPGSLLISHRDFQNMMDMSWRALTVLRDFTLSGEPGVQIVRRSLKALTSLREIQPHDPRRANWTIGISAQAGTVQGGRKRCSAAVAITLLKHRHNFRVADRLAIVANLCDYTFRLDTAQVESRFQSLAECLLALSMSNGDLSLLNPDFYSEKMDQERLPITILGREVHEYRSDRSIVTATNWQGLLPDISSILRHIDARYMAQPYMISGRVSTLYQLNRDHFDCPAYLFKVHRTVDFTPVRQKWQWHYRWLRTSKMPDADDVSEEQRLAMMQEAARQRLRKLCTWQRPTSLRVSDDVSDGCGLSTEAVESSLDSQATVGHIFLDMLDHLVNIQETSLANSLWQSLRADAILPDKTGIQETAERILPDDVRELLEDSRLHENPWKLLHLDANRQGVEFHQSWLFERVMNHGRLWVGRYVPHPADSTGKSDPSPEESIPTHEKISETPSSQVRPKPPGIGQSLRSRIIQRQLSRQLTCLQTLISSENSLTRRPSDPNLAVLDTATMYWTTRQLTLTETEKIEEDRARVGLEGAFDVDEQCLVMVPVDTDVERLPHPEERSMSLSWVVERLHDGKSSVLEGLPPTGTSGQAEQSNTTTETSPGQTEDVGLEKYRVVKKVRGSYGILELLVPTYKVA